METETDTAGQDALTVATCQLALAGSLASSLSPASFYTPAADG